MVTKVLVKKPKCLLVSVIIERTLTDTKTITVGNVSQKRFVSIMERMDIVNMCYKKLQYPLNLGSKNNLQCTILSRKRLKRIRTNQEIRIHVVLNKLSLKTSTKICLQCRPIKFASFFKPHF